MRTLALAVMSLLIATSSVSFAAKPKPGERPYTDTYGKQRIGVLQGRTYIPAISSWHQPFVLQLVQKYQTKGPKTVIYRKTIDQAKRDAVTDNDRIAVKELERTIMQFHPAQSKTAFLKAQADEAAALKMLRETPGVKELANMLGNLGNVAKVPVH